MASCSDDKAIKLWGCTQKKPKALVTLQGMWSRGHNTAIQMMDINRPGTLMCSAALYEWKLWMANTKKPGGKLIVTMKDQHCVIRAIAFHPIHDHLLATGNDHKTIVIYDISGWNDPIDNENPYKPTPLALLETYLVPQVEATEEDLARIAKQEEEDARYARD